ncbi:LacI family DNA-binding transcriptional regulator [Hoeflea prorocentri]|uniref:LacI family DNA-binding transcriptional regulator n=1 Tax=Hoeflea prorocentri TaxID=1922333 RepID=A0A9X3UFA8_9HYPH|nr:LacI family DNA-binding transcriptional regulator [Hoeflea prorocentri]MCY6379490.1 LacI family DNA-binding transcriptional regulator [Hoeflea prorocentri]MDA5397290.1 LacI family DNA-binding transcriptional regulator [Hoeflea prorocentri]
MSKRVTIKSIAKDLGISHMTVSRALSDNPNVHAKTREAVVRRAAELGYVKSAAAKAMRGDGTKIIGLLLPNIVNEFYARFANTLAEACEEGDYHLIIHLTNDDIELEQRSLQRLLEVQAMAAIMVPAPGDPGESLKRLGSMKIIQLIRQRRSDKPTASILVDDEAAIRDAVIHLAGIGHRAIAYIGADAALSSGRSRLSAFKSGLLASEVTEIAELIHVGSPSFEMGRSCARRILEERVATAIVCGGFEISNGALTALLEAGKGVLEEVEFVGYGDPSFYAWLMGGISTIRIPVDDLAFKAVDMLDGDASSGRLVSFPAELTVRGGVS